MTSAEPVLDEDLDDEEPETLDPTTYTRPALPADVRVIDGVVIRRVARLPEPSVRDAVAFVTTVDGL